MPFIMGGPRSVNKPDGKVKRALVTGAAGSLGAAVCQDLLRRQFHVLAVDHRAEAGRRLVEELRAWPSALEFCELDVRSPEAWGGLVEKLRRDGKGLALLANAAGTLAVGELEDCAAETIKDVLDVNLLGTMLACRACMQLLKATAPPGGRILNIGSSNAFLPIPWSAAYNASKAGICGFSESLAAELWESQVRVTVVCPGFFKSGLFDTVPPEPAALKRILEKLIARSTITAGDVASIAIDQCLRGRRWVVMPRTVTWWWRWSRWFPDRVFQSVARQAWQARRREEARLRNADR